MFPVNDDYSFFVNLLILKTKQVWIRFYEYTPSTIVPYPTSSDLKVSPESPLLYHKFRCRDYFRKSFLLPLSSSFPGELRVSLLLVVCLPWSLFVLLVLSVRTSVLSFYQSLSPPQLRQLTTVIHFILLRVLHWCRKPLHLQWPL